MTPPPPDPAHCRRGFTLAEVLIATTLAAAVATAAAAAIAGTAAARTSAAALLDRSAQLDGWARTGHWTGTETFTATAADHPAGHTLTGAILAPDGHILATRTLLRPGPPP